MAELLLVPHSLSAWYLSTDLPLTLMGLAALGAVAGGAAWLLWRRAPGAGAGVAWLLAFLLPVSGLVPIAGAILREYYLYLPAAGFFLLVGSGVDLLAARVGPRLPAAAAAAWGALLAFQTATHLPVWKDDLSLFTHIREASPGSRMAYRRLWEARFARGEVDEGLALMEEFAGNYPSSGNWRTLAEWAESKERPRVAERARKEAAEWEKRERRLALERGLALEAEGRREEAGNAYREAMPGQAGRGLPPPP
jgi:tetratricopeptide (TPR) repeat protein